MSEEKDRFVMGTMLAEELPADAEVAAGQKPGDPEPVEEVEGRDHNHTLIYYRMVTCPFSNCQAENRVTNYIHWVNCWSCQRNFHV